MGDVIKVGEYIVVEKQNYRKLHKLNKPDSSITIGRNVVSLAGVVGCPYFSVFKMIPKSKRGKECSLELTDDVVELKDEISIKSSGSDNRNIIDDGRSQKLSKEEIDQLTLGANKASDIVETLISNSNTFHNKTEFSQEKYLKKKEKKYFEYLQIIKPNLRLIAEIMYKLEPGKIQYLRLDTLSQIVTTSNIHCEGNHLLYDSGSNGLMTAALLQAIGGNTKGKLLHMHPGNMSQKQALLAMNFGKEQMDRCVSANIYSALRKYYQGNDLNEKEHSKTDPKAADIPEGNNDQSVVNKAEESSQNEEKQPVVEKVKENSKKEETESVVEKVEESSKNEKLQPMDIDNSEDSKCIANGLQNSTETKEANDTISEENQETDDKNIKRKADHELENGHKSKVPRTENGISEDNKNDYNNDRNRQSEPKIPKWHFDNIAAADLLAAKVDSLVIVCKEDPESIFMELMQFVKPGRPFVIYHPIVEPLENMYVVLKSHPRVSALKLTLNFMRNYQVLPDRTHPEVQMNSQSGFLLTGYILN